MVAQRLADDDEPRDHQEGRDEDVGEEAHLGHEAALMAPDVPVRDEVVEEMPERLADGDGHEGREVDVARGQGAEAVAALGDGEGEED